jgi:pyruvate dehydrogenase E2 component (dihydrolipoamide acetyltransferase)
VVDIVVPQLGEVAADIVLVRWLKDEGDAVARGEPLFEVDTDKYVVEIEAFASGILAEILVPAGSAVLPQQVVARLAPEGQSPEVSRVRPQTSRGDRVLASPKARALALELGIDLAGLASRGTGPEGLITTADVEAIGRATTRTVTATSSSSLRRTIAHRMQASKRDVPHFYLLLDVDMGEAERLRAETVQDLGWDLRPTITTLVVAACARSLESLPEVHVVFRDDEIIPLEQTNVGIAVDVTGGLLVPVLRNASRVALRELDERTRAAVGRARERRLLEADVGQRSMIVSNLGMHEVDAFVAIIDPPDPLILAVGRIADRCVAVNGVPTVRRMCTLTLSADHRAIDGVIGARFLAAVKDRLERPFELLEA